MRANTIRASTIFALTVAILIGLGLAYAAKLTGFFTTPQPVAEKKVEIQALVASRNLFAGDLIDTNGMRVRTLTASEVDHYQKHKDQYLPAVISAGFLRVPNKNIEADRPILRGDLEEMAKPKALNTRLLPDMRAVNLSLTKVQSAGGLIQVGEWVDVLLTSKVDGPGGISTKTANLVPRVRVIAKRNTLWPVFAPLPDKKPVEFTLEVNAYRAALLEFARTKGDITLALLPSCEQTKLEKHREEAIKQVAFVTPPRHFMEPSLSEAGDEDQRIVAVQKGELTVSEADLVRVFGLKTATTQPPLNSTEVLRMVGVKMYSPARFDPKNYPVMASGPGGAATNPVAHLGNGRASPVNDFQFNSPTCSTCADVTIPATKVESTAVLAEKKVIVQAAKQAKEIVWGAQDEYRKIVGQLMRVHVCGGRWVVRYAALDKEDRYGGSVVLDPSVELGKCAEGDIVCVQGEILNGGRAERPLGASLYRVNSFERLGGGKN